MDITFTNNGARVKANGKLDAIRVLRNRSGKGVFRYFACEKIARFPEKGLYVFHKI